MSDQIPSPQEQKTAIHEIEDKPLEIGSKAAVISHSWLVSWKLYTGYNNQEPQTITIDPIDNHQLFKDGKFLDFNREGVQYDIIHSDSYNLLHKWFGGDPIYEAPVVQNENGQPTVQLRFIPVILHYKGKTATVEIHKYMKISECIEIARKQFEIPNTTEVRLFGYQNSVLSDNPRKDNKFVSKYGIIKDEPLLVDTKNEDGHWDSDSLNHSTKTRISDIQETSLQSRHGGLVGLHNLGNTCFFNSGTQCLMHTVPLMKFMLGDEWERDLNPTNPIGMKGKLASAFAETAKQIWLGSSSVISPTKLKSTIGKFAPQFSGWGQQDSHELILFMLDGIHEDLNRCKTKENVESVEGNGTDDKEKAIEAWKRHKKRNDSIIVDLFHGQLRSQLDCPECQCRTVVFDPYMSIPMPMYKPHSVTIRLIFVPYDFSQKPSMVKFETSSSENVLTNEVVSQAISNQLGREIHVILGNKSFSTYPISWGYQKSTYGSQYAFEIPDESHFYLPCEIHMQKKSEHAYSHYPSDEMIGTPFMVDISSLPDNFDEEKQEQTSSSSDDEQQDGQKQSAANPPANGLEMFQQLVFDRIKVLWEQKPQENEVNEEITKEANRLTTDGKIKFEDTQKLAFEFKQEQKTVWKGMNYQYVKTPLKKPHQKCAIASTGSAMIYLNPKSNFSLESLLIRNSNIEQKKSSSTYRNDSADDSVTLDKCFEFLSTPEQLDENNKWFCPKCRQFVRATKKLDIWSVPEILIIQLKRFVAGGYYTSRKLETHVDFPDVLDMKDYVVGPQKNKSIKYRLFAVSIHMGGLGGGHYTAAANVQDPNASSQTANNWHYFNDSSVSQTSSANAHTSQAYVLFYERMK